MDSAQKKVEESNTAQEKALETLATYATNLYSDFPAIVPAKWSTMLSARQIKQFLSANTDENASHFVFMTPSGNILGHDFAADVPVIRKFAALAGPTWRLHDTALAETGKISSMPAAAGYFGGKVLQVVIKTGNTGLKSMIVEQDNFVGAVVYVKETTLLAALLEKEKFADEQDDLAMKVQGLKVKDGDEGETGANDEEDAGEIGSIKSADEGDPSEGKGKEPATADSKDGKPTKMRILEIRAEAIAEGLAEGELKEFKMPPGVF